MKEKRIACLVLDLENEKSFHLENIFYEFHSVKLVSTSFQGVRIEINKRFTEAKIVLNFIASVIVYWVTTAI
jgi:hypothetical protein